MKHSDSFQWEAAVGVAIVLALMCSIGIVGTWGTDDYWEFLKTSAPAWVQAVGSVVAVFVAVEVMRHGARRTAAAAHAHKWAFFGQLSTGVNDAVLVLEGGAGVGPIRMVRDQLLDCQQIGQTIPIAEVRPSSIWVVGEARQINARLIALLTDVEANDRSSGLDRRWACKLANGEAERLKRALATLE